MSILPEDLNKAALPGDPYHTTDRTITYEWGFVVFGEDLAAGFSVFVKKKPRECPGDDVGDWECVRSCSSGDFEELLEELTKCIETIVPPSDIDLDKLMEGVRVRRGERRRRLSESPLSVQADIQHTLVGDFGMDSRLVGAKAKELEAVVQFRLR